MIIWITLSSLQLQMRIKYDSLFDVDNTNKERAREKESQDSVIVKYL
jgi:hypothetical protein